jgi:hypothetical protein
VTRIVTEPMGNSILFPIGMAGPKDKRLMSRKGHLAAAARLIYLCHLRIMRNRTSALSQSFGYAAD